MSKKILSNILTATFVETPPSRIPYSAGVYDELTEYEGTATTAPYVIAGSNVYALNIIGKIKGVHPVPSVVKQDGIWSLLDKFKSLIADTAIINGANIGGFVFYDGWFISQDGTDLQGNPSTDYKNFPLGTFIPNLAQNSKSGKMYARDGEFSGELKGVTGSFKELQSVDSQGNVGGRIYFFEDGFGFSGRTNFYNRINSHESISLAGQYSAIFGGAVYAQQGFGHSTLVTLVIKGSTAEFYPRGLGYRAYREEFTLTRNNSAYVIPISRTMKTEKPNPSQPQTVQGFLPIDLVVFAGTPAGDYALESAIEGKQITVVCASNSRHSLYDFNGTRQVSSADIFYAIYLGNLLSGKSVDGRGKGWMMSYMNR